MIRKDVIQFNDAYGNPIEIISSETDTCLKIKLKGSNRNKRIHHDKDDNYGSSIIVPRQKNILKEEARGETGQNGFTNHRLIGVEQSDENNKQQQPSRVFKFDNSHLSRSLLSIVFSALVLLMFVSPLRKLKEFVNNLPILIVIPILFVGFKFVNQLFKKILYNQVTEESLLFYKKKPQTKKFHTNKLFNEPNELNVNNKNDVEKMPNIMLNNESNQNIYGYFEQVRRFRFKKTIMQQLPLEGLTISEILKGDRIMFSLVVKFYSKVNNQNLMLKNDNLNDDKHEIQVNDLNINVQQTKDLERPGEFYEIVMFDNFSPSFKCIDYIFKRIKAFKNN